MGKPIEQPCGTYAAYRRHLRKGEPTCEPCRAANRERSKSKRKKRHEETTVPVYIEAGSSEKSEGRFNDLVTLREVLWETLRVVAQSDPRQIPSVSKELRAVILEIDELKAKSQESEEVDPLAEFFNADVIDLHTASGR